MKSFRKIVKRIIGSIILVFGFFSCSDNVDSGHEHKFGSNWISDEINHWYECSGCSEVKSKENHQFPDEWIVLVAPTEINEGIEYRLCNVCLYEERNRIAELNHVHKYSSDWSSDEIYHWHAASCMHTQEYSNLAEHDWNRGEVTLAPTEDTEGIKTFTCTVCGQKRNIILKKLPISFDLNLQTQNESDWMFYSYEKTFSFNENLKIICEYTYKDGTTETVELIENGYVVTTVTPEQIYDKESVFYKIGLKLRPDLTDEDLPLYRQMGDFINQIILDVVIAVRGDMNCDGVLTIVDPSNTLELYALWDSLKLADNLRNENYVNISKQKEYIRAEWSNEFCLRYLYKYIDIDNNGFINDKDAGYILAAYAYLSSTDYSGEELWEVVLNGTQQ